MKTLKWITSRLYKAATCHRRSSSTTPFTHDQPVWQPTMLAIAAIGMWLAMVAGCEPKPADSPKKLRGQSIGTMFQQPIIRIRISRNADSLQLANSGQLFIKAKTAKGKAYRSEYVNAPVKIRRQNNTFIMATSDNFELRWIADELSINSTDSQPLQFDNRTYTGNLILHATSTTNHTTATQAAQSFDVVNHLPIENYLPGVIARELYSDWDLQTFKAQAIAARSYALDRRMLNRSKHYDMQSTQADQAYIGQTNNNTATLAVEQTRGQVLVYQYYVLPAYYSSTCGGIGQDARVGVGEYRNLLPLRGRNRGGWCRNASLYQWGPISRNSETLTKRLTAWGESRNNDIANLTELSHISITQYNTANRPTQFTLTATDGQSYTLTAEALRIASNYSNQTLPPLTRDQQIKSSFVQPTVNGNKVIFADGRGFGHGVGLCQFGAQAMATSGHDANAILKFYYPGTEIIKAY